MVYPVPDPTLPFLGVHVTKHIHGDVLLGPTAMLVPSRDGYLFRTARPRDIWETLTDRKSTRLNSSHQIISYAVFCLKKKKNNKKNAKQPLNTHTLTHSPC